MRAAGVLLLLLLPLAARCGVMLLLVHTVGRLWRQHVCYSLLLRRLGGV
jgi:hypothetical protein